MEKKKNRKRLWLILPAVLLVIGIVFGMYVGTYSHALPYTAPTLADGTEIPVGTYEGFTVYGDSDAEVGVLFYPGGKVETEAYQPLYYGLAEQGVCCVSVDMPFHLAIFNVNAADSVLRQMTSVRKWYLCGHSLGGVTASMYLADHPDAASGMIFLAAYPTDPLDCPVLSLYGSEDGVLNREAYGKGIALAENLTEVVLDGGNHAGFGNYGEQSGDNPSSVTPEEQWNWTVSEILSFIQ